MNKISKSIWSNECLEIPMAEVSFVEKVKCGIQIVMKHSKWQDEFQHWSPMIVMGEEKGKKFLSDWYFYRYELEGGKKGFKESYLFRGKK